MVVSPGSGEPVDVVDGPASDRVRLRRAPHKARYDRTTIDAVLDATPFCTLAYVLGDGGPDAGADGGPQPVAVPTLHARDGDRLLVHGSTGATATRVAVDGGRVCVTVSIVDGVVLARSGMHHSVNHRSVVVLGTAAPITDPGAKTDALRVITERVVPGRWAHVRPPTRRELAATAVLTLPLTEASAKVRTGPPVDDEADLDPAGWGAVWAGVVPVRTVAGDPVPDPGVPAGTPTPDHVRSWTPHR